MKIIYYAINGDPTNPSSGNWGEMDLAGLQNVQAHSEWDRVKRTGQLHGVTLSTAILVGNDGDAIEQWENPHMLPVATSTADVEIPFEDALEPATPELTEPASEEASDPEEPTSPTTEDEDDGA